MHFVRTHGNRARRRMIRIEGAFLSSSIVASSCARAETTTTTFFPSSGLQSNCEIVKFASTFFFAKSATCEEGEKNECLAEDGKSRSLKLSLQRVSYYDGRTLKSPPSSTATTKSGQKKKEKIVRNEVIRGKKSKLYFGSQAKPTAGMNK